MNLRGILPRLAAAALAGLAITNLPCAQLAGSQSYQAAAQNVAAVSGLGASSSFGAIASAGQLTNGMLSLSASYFALGGVFAPPEGPSLPCDGCAPVVLHIDPPSGLGVGADLVTLTGVNFDSLGAGATTVTFTDPSTGTEVEAFNVVVESDAKIKCVTPPGLNQFDNPLGLVDVMVENSNGFSALCGGYTFQPALTAFPHDQPKKVKKRVVVKLSHKFSSFFFALPGPPLGGGAPLGNYMGSLEVLPGTVILASLFPSNELIVQLIFDDPSLVGLTLTLQSLVIEESFNGGFTNKLDLDFEVE